jgi:hypothetical protein
VRILLVAGALAALLGLTTVGCRSRDDATGARAAVQRYLDKTIEAYRVSDAALMDPYVNEQQGRKLTGLIGVKRDAGVYLDAMLLSIEYTLAERRGDRWVVETRERWAYRDRKIGSGQQVGDESLDSYQMRYTFSRDGRRWVLEDLEFTAPPVVGRKSAPIPVDARILHGVRSVDGPKPDAPGAGVAVPAK